MKEHAEWRKENAAWETEKADEMQQLKTPVRQC